MEEHSQCHTISHRRRGWQERTIFPFMHWSVSAQQGHCRYNFRFVLGNFFRPFRNRTNWGEIDSVPPKLLSQASTVRVWILGNVSVGSNSVDPLCSLSLGCWGEERSCNSFSSASIICLPAHSILSIKTKYKSPLLPALTPHTSFQGPVMSSLLALVRTQAKNRRRVNKKKT